MPANDRSDERPADRLPLALSVLLGGIFILRVLWCGVTYPESTVVVSLALAALCIVTLLGAAFSRGMRWRFDGADMFAALYFLVILVLSLLSERRWLARDFLLQTGSCTAAYFLAVNFSTSRRARLALWAGIAVGTLLVALYALYQRFWGLAETRHLMDRVMAAGSMSSAMLSRVSSTAVFSTFVYPNALAGYCIAVIPLMALIFFLSRSDAVGVAMASYLCVLAAASIARGFYTDLYARPFLFAWLYAATAVLAALLAMAQKRVHRAWLAAACAPLVVLPLWALAYTASEGAWLALVCSVLVCSLAAAGRGRAAAFVALSLACLLVVAASSGIVPAELKQSLGARGDYWRAALHLWLRHPFGGTGPGTFPVGYMSSRMPASEEGRLAHSIYLGLASETGLVGLAAFVCFWGSVLLALLPEAKRGDRLSRAVLMSACAFLLHGAIDVDLNVPGTTMAVWILAGIAIGACPSSRTHQMKPMAGLALALLVAAAAVFWLVPHARAERHRLRAIRYEMEGDAARARQEILRAVALDRDNPVYWTALAGIDQRGGRDDLACTALSRAAALADGVASYHLRLAICRWRLSGAGSDHVQAAAAICELRKAILGNPHDVDSRLLMGFWSESVGQRGEALIEYRSGLKLIQAALGKPGRIRSLSTEEYRRLAAMVAERIAQLQGQRRPPPHGEDLR
jgi:O-antigen ligase